MWRRVGTAVATLILAVLLTFVLLRLTPGNPLDNLARQYAIQFSVPLSVAYQRVAEMYNYNPHAPIVDQLMTYVRGLLHGSLGHSLIYQNESVNTIIANGLPWTAFVISISLFISFVIGITLGVLMAYKRDTILDPVISVYAVATTALPNFLFAVVFLVVFAYGLNWFPTQGAYNVNVTPGLNLPFLLSVLHHAALPMITYIFTSIGGWILSMKGSSISVLGEDYVMAARARGLPERTIMGQYVRRNAIIPQVTSLAIALGYLFGGSVLIENVFSYPGLGYFLAQAVTQRDYTTMQGIFLFIAVMMIVSNFAADMIYSKLDPRVRVGG